MKRLPLFFAFIVLIISSACNDEQKTTSMQVAFKGKYGDDPLIMYKSYDFHSGMNINFTMLNFYLTDFTLIKENGEEEVIHDLEFVDISASHEDNASANVGYVFDVENIPIGKYKGIRFNIGVPPELNSMTPADFASNNPLSKTSHYWESWQSYIFNKIEGNLDTLGTGDLNTGFAIHSGSDELFRILQINYNFELKEDQQQAFNFHLDHQALLKEDNGYLDIKTHRANHKPENLPVMRVVMNNFANALVLVI